MGIFFFYNNRKPRRFNYRPVLYDPKEEARSEEMEKRIRRIKAEVAEEEGKSIDIETQKAPTDFGGEFLSQTKHLKRRKERYDEDSKPFYTNNISVILLLAVLAVLFYILFLR